MSRCFPFPPLGYAKNVSRSEALIESIKLQNESKKAKKDRKKDKRREKKDKRNDRKRKEGTASQASDGKELKFNELEKNNGCVQKGDYEQLERSDITEERARPISTPEPCCSDSTQSSNKRKRNTSPSSHNHGAVVKVRLSLRKHTEPEEPKLEDHLVSTSRCEGTADTITQDTTHGADHPLPCVTNAETERDQYLGNYDSIHCEAAPSTNLLDVERMRMGSVYNSLFQNWVPPPTTCDDGFKSEDRDWLFSLELQEERPISKKVKAVTGALRCSSASLWPRAQYLPEVESYALPYAVPF